MKLSYGRCEKFMHAYSGKHAYMYGDKLIGEAVGWFKVYHQESQYKPHQQSDIYWYMPRLPNGIYQHSKDSTAKAKAALYTDLSARVKRGQLQNVPYIVVTCILLANLLSENLEGNALLPVFTSRVTLQSLGEKCYHHLKKEKMGHKSISLYPPLPLKKEIDMHLKRNT